MNNEYMKPITVSCETCQYWKRDKHSNWGECEGLCISDKVIIMGQEFDGIETLFDFLCAEYKGR